MESNESWSETVAIFDIILINPLFWYCAALHLALLLCPYYNDVFIDFSLFPKHLSIITRNFNKVRKFFWNTSISTIGRSAFSSDCEGANQSDALILKAFVTLMYKLITGDVSNSYSSLLCRCCVLLSSRTRQISHYSVISLCISYTIIS